MGTLHFVAPEAMTLGVGIDHRADIYAVGVMLYQMLTGRLPQGLFEMPSLQVPALDPRYDAIVASAMREDRLQRYQHIHDMRRALDAIVTQPVKIKQQQPAAPAQTVVKKPTHQARLPGQGYGRPPSAPPPAPKRSSRGWLASLLIFGVLSAGYYTWFYHPQRKTVQYIEGESLVVLNASGGRAEARDDVGRQASAVWSGGAHLWWMNAKKNNILTLKLPINESGKQCLKIVFPLAENGGIAAVSLDGRPVPGSPFDFYAHNITLAGATNCGVWDLKAGDHELQIELLGTHGKASDSEDTCMGIDVIRLEPLVLDAPPVSAGTDVALLAKPSASFCSPGFHVEAINDGRDVSKSSSNKQSAPHQTWFPRRSGMEWAQYEWEAPQVIDECQIFWFDDTTVGGECALPLFWRLSYREDSGAWVPLDTVIPAVVRDKWSIVKFPAAKTTALRITVQCAENKSAGMCHWKVLVADPASATDPEQRHLADLTLTDMPPLRDQVGWGIFHVNYVDAGTFNRGERVVVDGRPCDQYLWAHADSRIEFAIPQGYTRFTAVAVPDTPIAYFEGTWKCLVQVDGRTLLETEQLKTRPDKKLPVDVTFPLGSKRLTLLIDSCENGSWDCAYWANPTLTSGSPPITESKTPTAPVPSLAVTPVIRPPPAIPAAPAPPVPVTPPMSAPVVPKEDDLSFLQYVSIIGVDRKDAAAFLAQPKLKSAAQAVLSDLHGMALSGRTAVVANLSSASRSGNRSVVTGAYGFESEVIVQPDGILHAQFAVHIGGSAPSSKLVVTDVSARRGQTLFLGSFEDSTVPAQPVRLVFVTFR